MKNKSALWSLLFLGAVLLIILINTEWLSPDHWLWGAFPATAGLMTVAILAIGIVLNGRPEGLIIDNRNRMSLSKLQMLAWTVVVISALTASAAYNVHHGFGLSIPPNKPPLQIDIPNELLFAMGIAAASFVATPTILSLKAQETPTDADVTSAQNAAPPAPAPAAPVAPAVANLAAPAPATNGLQNSGKVHGRTDPSGARWSDLFQGDEVGNSDTPDLSKIQQFGISLLLITIYSSQVIAGFMGLQAKPIAHIDTLPILGTQFVTLLAISHASYLVYKAAPHTASAPTP